MDLKVGGKCLAFHGPLLYEAKVLKIWDANSRTVIQNEEGRQDEIEEEENLPSEQLKAQDCYFIHYQGWKSTWDEWIGLDRIKEYNAANNQIRKDLVQAAKEAKKQDQKKKKAAAATGTAAGNNLTGANGSGRRKRGDTPPTQPSQSSGPQSQSQSNYHQSVKQEPKSNGTGGGQTHTNMTQFDIVQPKITLHIPNKLKCKLVDDWEYITKNKQILSIPSNISINKVLKDYAQDLLEESDISLVESAQSEEFIAGIRQYFQASLPRFLLYRLERLQYEEMLAKTPPKLNRDDLCEVYGPIHLLRLMSVLPELVASTTMDQQSCQLIISQCENLLLWMTMHINELFCQSNYVNTSSQYEGVALGL
ncbi:Eaf3p KNAG_0D02210 [Huiozyma naganishii CBS 8797]|uniref:Chromatin modification-related protein EAF3 n=1 Tax=Huiozyma naganishii (strain ATCC MYA-139 / BCRC 22969 / CBS 8797 / KCTC 17520 / NBRC 10181 / NCYC 3082 / Yp74L-3) TaxID=1071383 RepID=J7S6X2_HUIN7|nr:hypothetical protein KNAG_0D02210 [Kazachstania naganishii CBS 8797]CCK69971.1 hypothetical protein KNAG_0D02210 [Kazachstania naganishii CBS 8797]